jgi:GT2 family glycosyltransferase
MISGHGAKRFIQRRLSYTARLRGRRLFVNTVAALVRFCARAYDAGVRLIEIAESHGLDLQRAWDVRRRRLPKDPTPENSFGPHDFLLLTEKLRARESALPQTSAELITNAAREPKHDSAVGRRIRASVIIPVFNKVEFTFQCLRSLLAEIEPAETEIILVDDASTDETARVLSNFGGLLRVISNERNLGFVESCNRGAAEARGDFLVFLNNDATVEPGWLRSLVKTAEADENVGAVGSLFLYPDGRVQEAGGGVWRDGEAFRYGWGRSPEDRRLLFAREVDYCSGASLLVRRELFEQLGGFDMRYAPAYYEDVDLCIGVCSLGRKVVYQPLSRVVHYEGATGGRDVGSVTMKRYQALSYEQFRAKWRDVLSREHCERGQVSEERAADRRRGPELLVVSDRLPTPERDAGSARVVCILGILARTYRVVFVGLNKGRSRARERALWRLGVETMGQADFLREAGRGRFAAAIITHPDAAEALLPALRGADSRLKIVFDMFEAHFIRAEREYALTRDERAAQEAERYRALESRLAGECDLVWCVSPDDARAVKAAAPKASVEVIPTIHTPRDEVPDFDEREGILFVGNFDHRPNVDAVHFLVRHVLPSLRERLNGVPVFIAGPNAPEEVRSYAAVEGVRVMGFVPDLEPLHARARVFVAPLRFGAGVKGKIGEALAHGVPVVTTSVGAEGMGIEHGSQAVVVDGPREMATAIAGLYRDRDLWRRLSAAGRAHVNKVFAPNAVAETIEGSILRLTAETEKDYGVRLGKRLQALKGREDGDPTAAH